MSTRIFGAFSAYLLSFAFSPNLFAAVATANVMFDWTTFEASATGDLEAIIAAPMGDDGSVFAQGGTFESDLTASFGGLDLTSTGPSSSASLVTTADSIDASANTTFGYGTATFERFFSYEALSGSGILTLSVDVVVQAEVQGAGTFADSEALFGYEVGDSGVIASLAGLEMSGDSGDQSQILPTTLSFSVFMQQGDVIDMFAEGGAEVSAIPIPAAAWLFGSGLLGLAGIGRYKKAA